MAQADMITIENISDVAQWVIVGDEEHVLPQYAVLDFPPEVATEFFTRCPRWVREYEPVKLPEPEPGEPVRYVANMTGSPFHPETVTLTLIQRGKEVDEPIQNPLRIPHVVKHTMMGGSIIQPCRRDPTSNESLNLPPTVIQVPPFRRFRVGLKLADWLIKRDAAQIPQLSGELAMVREPRDFEPQRRWPLLDLQIYGEYLDRGTFSPDHPVFGDLMRKGERDYETEADLNKARQSLWEAIWFRALDERFGNCSPAELKRKRGVLTATKGKAPMHSTPKGLAQKLKEGGA